MQQPFDLERGPLFRAQLLRLSAEEHIAVVVMHHIVSDGWSIGVLIREVEALYAAYSQGGASPLPALALFSMQTMRCGSAAGCRARCLQQQVAYWKEHLNGSARGAGAADRPAATGGAELSRRAAWFCIAGGTDGVAQRTGARARARRCSWCCWRRSMWCCRAGAASRTLWSVRRCGPDASSSSRG